MDDFDELMSMVEHTRARLDPGEADGAESEVAAPSAAPPGESWDDTERDEVVFEDVEPTDIEDEAPEFSADEVPVLPPEGELDVDPAGPQERATEPAVPQAKPEAAESLLERLQNHRPTQFGVALIVGAGVLAVLQVSGGAASEPVAFDAAPAEGRRFPKIPVDGLEEPLSSDDVRRLLSRVGDDAAPRVGEEAPPSDLPPEPSPRGRVRAVPGELYDDHGRVGAVVDTRDDEIRALRREAAAARATAAAAAKREQEEKPGLRPEFFAPGGTLKVRETAPTKNRPSLDLEVGTLFEATLLVGVSSLAPNVVVARVKDPVRVRGRTIVHRGATLRGSAQPQQDRLFLRFHSLEQRGETFRLEAYAADKRMPGVPALVRAASLEERGKSGAGRGAAGAVGGVIGELVGQTLPGRVARSVAEGVATEAQQDLQPDRSRVLELPVGRTFQVIVAGGAS